MIIHSHTLVKNGMPYIVPVLEQVVPYMDQCLVTISVNSTDGTAEAIGELQVKYPNKILVSYENVKNPGELTEERQKQIIRSREADWILFLDADDYWTSTSIERVLNIIKEGNTNHLAYAFNPYQVVSKTEYDDSWRYKYFTKVFKNHPALHYRKEWPKDIIYIGDEYLYWRASKKVYRPLETHYYHLSNLMKWRFRDENWANGKFGSEVGVLKKYPKECLKEIETIFNI